MSQKDQNGFIKGSLYKYKGWRENLGTPSDLKSRILNIFQFCKKQNDRWYIYLLFFQSFGDSYATLILHSDKREKWRGVCSISWQCWLTEPLKLRSRKYRYDFTTQVAEMNISYWFWICALWGPLRPHGRATSTISTLISEAVRLVRFLESTE